MKLSTPLLYCCSAAILLGTMSPVLAETTAPNTPQTLLNTLLNKLPENQNSAALQSLAQSNERAANAWIAGDVEVLIKHENDSMTGNQGYQSWEMGAMFPLWLSGQSDAKQQLGQNYRQLMQNKEALLRLQASKKLRQLIWQLKKAELTVSFNEKNHQQALSLQKLVKQRVTAGENPKIDLLMAEQATLTAFRQLMLSQQAYQIALKDYSAWTNSQQLPTNFAETKHTLPLEEHPLLKMLASVVSIENEKLQLVTHSQKQNPNLYLGGKTDKNHQTADNTMLIAQISFPLGINKQSSIAVSEQNQAKTQAEIALAKAKQQLEIDQKNADILLIQAQKNQDITQQELALSQQTVQLATHAYQQGETSIQILLQMTQQLYENELNFELSKVNKLKAISDVNQTQGVSL